MAQRSNRAAVIDADAQANLNLGERYEYRDRDRVNTYLAAHPYLVEILREADPEIAKRFGEATKVTLAVEDDVDQVGVETLWGFIRTPLPTRDARDLLDRLDREWWIARSANVYEELGLDIRFG